MTIFKKIALKSLQGNRARTAVTIVGVMLSTALVTGIVCFVVSLQAYMVSGAIEKYGNWEVGFTNVDQSFVKSQKNDSHVEDIGTFNNIGYAKLTNCKNPYKPYVFLAGFNDETERTLPITLISGRMPENEKEIVIPSHLASNGGVCLSLGDTVTFNVGQRQSFQDKAFLAQDTPFTNQEEKIVNAEPHTYTIVGICQRPSFEDIEAPGYTIITKNSTTSSSSKISAFIGLKDPRDVRDYINDIESDGLVLNDHVLRFLGLSDDVIFNTLLYTVVIILAAIIMIGSICLIYNSFNISLGERMQQIGMLLSIGATPKQLLHSVLFEGFCIGLIGIPAGLIIGLPSIAFVLQVASERFNTLLYDNVPLKLQVSPLALGITVLMSIIIITISAMIPARKALKTPIMDCIRKNTTFRESNNVVKTPRVIMQLLGYEGMIAYKNFKRNKRQYRNVVASLILSILLFISACTFCENLQQGVGSIAEVTNYDIGLTVEDMDEESLLSLYDSLGTIDGVKNSNMQAIYQEHCMVDESLLSEKGSETLNSSVAGISADLSILCAVIDDQSYEQYCSKFRVTEGTLIGVACLLDENASDLFAQKNFSLTINDKLKQVTLVDEMLPDIPPSSIDVSANKSYYFEVLIPWSQKNILFENKQPVITGMTFQSDTPQHTTTIMKEILEQDNDPAEYTLMNVHDMLEENSNIRFIIQLFSGIFIGMITLIAIANVFNTIATNIRLRCRELSMLRSIGMGERSFSKMMRIECIFYGLWTLILGLPLAMLIRYIIDWGMNKGGAGNLIFSVPWDSLMICVIAVFVIIFFTMMYVVHKIKKANIIEAIRTEMV